MRVENTGGFCNVWTIGFDKTLGIPKIKHKIWTSHPPMNYEWTQFGNGDVQMLPRAKPNSKTSQILPTLSKHWETMCGWWNSCLEWMWTKLVQTPYGSNRIIHALQSENKNELAADGWVITGFTNDKHILPRNGQRLLWKCVAQLMYVVEQEFMKHIGKKKKLSKRKQTKNTLTTQPCKTSRAQRRHSFKLELCWFQLQNQFTFILQTWCNSMTEYGNSCHCMRNKLSKCQRGRNSVQISTCMLERVNFWHVNSNWSALRWL